MYVKSDKNGGIESNLCQKKDGLIFGWFEVTEKEGWCWDSQLEMCT